MGKTIGIDLGTTNSVICIVGDVPKCVHYGRVSVLADSIGRDIHASAICECDGTILFGDDAKIKAAEGFAPLRFWKRYMGKEMLFPLKGKQAMPQDLSRELLVYLKTVAAQALGEEVDGAVITHPAYFGGDAIGATREAGDAAGLNVGERGLMMEPIAAALAYLQDDPDPTSTVRVMVYDLGGGTFDITILQRENGVFQPLAFGGDPELGGYNFDKALANYMLKELTKQGYKITIKPDAPEADIRWAKLMHIAEEIKLKLSKEGREGLKADVREPSIFLDEDKKSVRLAITITRDQFESLISKDIEHTIECCKEVLKTANLGMDKIDRAILVGGSSRLPLVQRRLAEEFGRPFEFDNAMVDLCVGIGAALYAGSRKQVVGGFLLDSIPDKTSAEEIVVSGFAQPTADVADTAGCVVTLSNGTHQEPQVAADKGGFLISFPLTPRSVNSLVLTAQTTEGKEFARHTFSVTHDPKAGEVLVAEGSVAEGGSFNFLAKTLSVETTNRGLVPIANEGLPLPLDIKVDRLRTLGKDSPEVEVKLFQADMLLASILLKDFSKPVPEGTPVHLTVHVGTDYSMSARAEIPVYNAFAEIKKIEMPKPARPALDELKARRVTLEQKYREQMQLMPPGEEKLLLGAQADEILTEVDRLMTNDAAPDVFRIERLLNNLQRALKEHSPDSMTPTRQEMNDLFAKARELLPQAEAKDPALKKKDWGKTLDVLSSQADQAYSRRDRRTWETAAKNIKDLVADLERMLRPPTEIPPAPDLIMYVRVWLGDLEKQARAAGRYNEPQIQQGFAEVRSALNGVDISAPDAKNQVIRIIQGPYSQLEKMLLPRGEAGKGGGLTFEA